MFDGMQYFAGFGFLAAMALLVLIFFWPILAVFAVASITRLARAHERLAAVQELRAAQAPRESSPAAAQPSQAAGWGTRSHAQ